MNLSSCSESADDSVSGPVTVVSTEIRSLLDRVLTALTESGVAWALLRGRSELATGRDVDLLVGSAHLSVAEEVVFEFGGVPLPQRRYPWHKMFVFDVPGEAGAYLKLDIVDRLVYHRELKIASGLERGCLERRHRDGPLFLLSPTDAFWTILLHCLLDKRHVKPGRAEELLSAAGKLNRPSAGEAFFASLCPPGWSPDRAIASVVSREWQQLGQLGSQILSLRHADAPSPKVRLAPADVASGPARRSLADKAIRRLSSAATGGMYRKVWRGLRLGAVPRVVDLVDEAMVDATVIELRRRPGRCDVLVSVPVDQLCRLLPKLKRHYRPILGVWRRVTMARLESVRLISASEHRLSERLEGLAPEQSLHFPGRTHCRLALLSPDIHAQ
jgi:hypothetical protein